MLAHILAIAVSLSSLVLFLTAFSMSDIHRRDDFLWSGIGLFYALVLWFCASQITGSLLLGQAAAVALVISFNWQNLKLRKAIANPDQPVETGGFSVTELISGFFNRSSGSNSQPNITQVLEEETNVNDSIPVKENPVSTEIDQETTLDKTSFEDVTLANDNPVITEIDQETIAEISSPTLSETNFEDLTPAIAQETIERDTSDEVSFSRTESNDLIESTTESNLEIDTAAEQDFILPTIEEDEELTTIQQDAQTQSNFPNLAEEVTLIQETTQVESSDENYSEFNLKSQAEEINEEKPIDVKFTTSEIGENPQSSIDDFLADLDKGTDKPAEEK